MEIAVRSAMPLLPPLARRAAPPAAILGLLLCPAGALAEELHPAGTVISNAAAVDITPEGFDAITDLIPGFLPSEIAIPEMGAESNTSFPACLLGGYAYSLTNGKVAATVNSATITPQTGELALNVNLGLQVNSSSDPMVLAFELECIGDSCDGYVDPFEVNITTTLGLDVVDDGTRTYIDATVGELTVTHTLDGDMIHLSGCAIGTIADVLAFFGLNIYDLILTVAEPFLQDAIAAFGPQIETLLEDALAQASIEQQLDVNGILVDLALAPSDIEITPAGARIYMDGSMSTDAVAECVSPYDPGGSLATDTPIPDLGVAPAGIGDYHMGVHLSDDIGNQAMYALWRGGLLCYDVGALIGDALGAPTTALLGTLVGDAFKDMFPESKPIGIFTRPEEAPTLAYNTDNDAALQVHNLGLDIYAEVADRQVLLVGMNLDVDAGADINFDPASGAMAVAVDLGEGALSATVVDNEFKPDASSGIEEHFNSSIMSLVEPILSSQLGALAFSLPAVSGFGLTGLELSEEGDAQDWLGVFATVGPVTYAGAGCGADGGGCGGGCGTSGLPGGRSALFAFPVALAFLRRRRA